MLRRAIAILASLAAAGVVFVAIDPSPAAAARWWDVDSFLCSTGDTVELRNLDGRHEKFWVGLAVGPIVDGEHSNLWHKWQRTDGTWTSPVSLGGDVFGGVAGARNADGRLEIFVRGTNNKLYHIWQQSANSGWSTWASLGGQIDKAPSCAGINSKGGIRIDAHGIDGLYHEIYQMGPSGPWSGWVWPGDGEI